MGSSIDKLQKLRQSVQKLESVLQEVWSTIDEIEEDEGFKKLLNRAKQFQKQKPGENLEDLCEMLDEFEKNMEQIPEDGTAAVDFEDAISELIDWMENNK